MISYIVLYVHIMHYCGCTFTNLQSAFISNQSDAKVKVGYSAQGSNTLNLTANKDNRENKKCV